MEHQTDSLEGPNSIIYYGYDLLTENPIKIILELPTKRLSIEEKKYMNSWQHSFIKLG